MKENKLPSFSEILTTIQPPIKFVSKDVPEQKQKFTPTKEYQNEQKQKQRRSLILRTFVFMRLLVCNHHYSFVINRNKRPSHKTLEFHPIEKVYDPQGNILFDAHVIKIDNGNKKTKYCQRYVVEMMIEELEKFGYIFGKV